MIVDNFIRSASLVFDTAVYSLISILYKLLMDIATVDLLAPNVIDAFADRVYALLAVFMLFRLSFSILTYIINPENSNDKGAGAGKLIGNVLITLVMLISSPWIFTQVRNLQSDILEDNILQKIILGTASKGVNKNELVTQQVDPGANMAWTTFEAFFYPNDEGNLSSYEVDSGDAKTAWNRVKNSKSVGALKRSGLVNLTNGEGEYLFEYLPIVSLIAGGFIAYILLLFCIQIAVRSVKLSVLQLIAPIPIISYIDPKQGKDGMFKKWYKLCIKTFADLFIRLAAIYFAVFIISQIGMSYDESTLIGSNVFVKLAIIIGALMFAKELPKFIEEITGIKLSGGFSLNPFKNNAALSALAGGALGAGLGVAGAMTGAGVGGIFTGAARGMKSGFGGKKIGEITSSQISKNAQMRTARLNESTFAGRMGARVGNALGTGGELANIERAKTAEQDAIKKIDDDIKAIEDQKKRIQGTEEYIQRQAALKDQKAVADSIKSLEERAKSEISNGKGGTIGAEYLKRKATAEYLKNNIGKTGLDGKTKITTEMAANAEAAMNDYLNGKGMKDYMTQATSGDIDDATFRNLRATAEVAASNIGVELSTDGSEMHVQLGQAKEQAGALERAGNEDNRKIAEYDAQIAEKNREKAPHNDAIRDLDRREARAKANKDAIGGK